MAKHRRKFNPNDPRCWDRAKKSGALGQAPPTKRLLEQIAANEAAEKSIEARTEASALEAIYVEMRVLPPDGLDVPRTCSEPLLNIGIETIGELQHWSQAELELIPKIGAARAHQISVAMTELGLPLANN